MEKKNLKFYVSPEMETIDVELEGSLLAGSGGSFTDDQGGWEDDE